MSKVEWYGMSKEAQRVAVLMLEYCVESGIRMGMDEGFNLDDTKKQFRVDIENFIKTQ